MWKVWLLLVLFFSPLSSGYKKDKKHFDFLDAVDSVVKIAERDEFGNVTIKSFGVVVSKNYVLTTSSALSELPLDKGVWVVHGDTQVLVKNPIINPGYDRSSWNDIALLKLVRLLL